MGLATLIADLDNGMAAKLAQILSASGPRRFKP
jgi:hypothetical protein